MSPTTKLRPGSLWLHYKKDEVYEFLHMSLLESTQEPLAIYRKPGDATTWCRPLKEWEEVPEGSLVPRFRPLGG